MGVPASACSTELHEVVHAASGRRAAYGSLVAAASRLPVPPRESLQLKPSNAWRYIGKPGPTYDLKDICTGAAVFGMDARRDGMVYAAIARSPVFGGRVRSVDDGEALRVAGVRRTVAIPPLTPPVRIQGARRRRRDRRQHLGGLPGP